MGAVNDLTEQRLRELAQAHTDEQSALSLYLDLDPTRFATPPARTTEIVSLLDRAHRLIEEGERSHTELQALRSGLQRARELLEGQPSWAGGARALALFICEPLGLEQLLRLPHPLQSAVVISNTPFIPPLAESPTGPPSRVCVALVDERCTRILRGSPERLQEVVSFGDSVHGRHDQGGWSQARYQRSQQEDVDAHLRHVSRVLHDLLRIAPYDRLLVGCTEPLWPRVLGALHPDVRSRLLEQRLSLDIPNVGIEDVVRAAAPILIGEREAHVDALLEQLRERHGRHPDGRACVGLKAVLHALVERRVEALLYDARLHPAGAVCPRCGWMDTEGVERCPVDGEQLESRANILDDAVQSAVNQSAEVVALVERPELGSLQGIAATLRF